MTGRSTGFGQTTLEGVVEKATDAAILFLPLTGTEFWIPRRVCLDGDSIDEADEDVCVADWWLKQEGHL